MPFPARCRWPRSSSLRCSAVLETAPARRGRRSAAGARRCSPRSSRARNPVLVTTLGRTGSMLLMRMLEAHPEVLVYRPYRFEQRIASYWADMLLALAEPASYIRQIAPAADLDDPAWWLGSERRCRGACATRRCRSGSAAKRSRRWRARSSSASRRSTTASSRPPTRATPRCSRRSRTCGAANLLTELYADSREMFLVRDFRDMVASILSFNAKRDVPGSGARARPATPTTCHRWAAGPPACWGVGAQPRRRAPRALRGPDHGPRAHARELLTYLGVDAAAGTVAEVRARLADDLPELAITPRAPGPTRRSDAGGATWTRRWPRNASARSVRRSRPSATPRM